MALAALQGSYNGLTFGPGTDVQITSISGIRGVPIRNADQSWPGQAGALPGLNLFGERVIVLTLQVFAPASGTPTETVLEGIATAFQNIEDPALGLPFSYMLPTWSESRWITARPTNFDIPLDSNYVFNVVTVPVQLTCADPLFYSNTTHTATLGLPTPTAGLTFPVTFPASFGSSSGGAISVTNAGNYAAPAFITITGPCTNPVVGLGSGSLALNITMGSSDVITIDTSNLAITLNGAASRFNDIATGSEWLYVPVGSSNFTFGSADSSPVAATATLDWNDAWGQM